MGAPGMGGPGMYGAAPAMGYGGAPGFAPPQRKTGMSGCGIAAIVGAVVALLFGGLIVVGAIAAASNSDNDDTSSNPPPDAPPSDDGSSEPSHDDIPDTGALRSLLHDRVGGYRLKGVGEVTNIAPILQGGVADTKYAEYAAPNGQTVTLAMIAYSSESIATSKINAVEGLLRVEPGAIVVRSQVLNKQRRPVGARLRVTGADPQRVYWNNGKLLCIVTAPAPHAIGFEMVAPF